MFPIVALFIVGTEKTEVFVELVVTCIVLDVLIVG